MNGSDTARPDAVMPTGQARRQRRLYQAAGEEPVPLEV